jgi:phosphoribosyl 1,2-cyclic phosphodiesterase
MITRFHGVRGSTACHGEDTRRYGGNTSCVSVSIPGHDPLLFDMGTGLRYFGASLPDPTAFRGTCLLSHLHWDHVQGLPFFQPLQHPDSVLDVYAPPPPDTGETVSEVMARTIHPPLFPVTLDELAGTVRFHDVTDDRFTIAGQGAAGEGADAITVTSRLIPHVGSTCGYRVEWNGRSVSYLSDHQQPVDGSFTVSPGALELCQGVDVLIHDSQYTPAEFALKNTWGHCTAEYALWLAGVAGARTLVLFHHDPTHDDDQVDGVTAAVAACGRAQGIEVIAAFEGMALTV